jgi:hypothetical protein
MLPEPAQAGGYPPTDLTFPRSGGLHSLGREKVPEVLVLVHNTFSLMTHKAEFGVNYPLNQYYHSLTNYSSFPAKKSAVNFNG